MAPWVADYISMSEEDARLFHMVTWIVGGLLAGFLLSTQADIRRAYYFAASSFLIVCASLSQLVWLAAEHAIIKGYLGAFVVWDVAVSVFLGGCAAQLAKARSRNAFGTTRYAWAAFVPLANLVLLFRTARVGAPPVERDYRPVLMVVVGFVGIFVYAGVAVGLRQIQNEQNLAIERDPQRTAAIEVAVVGVEKTIDDMVASVSAPYRIDTLTTLQAVQRVGRVLRYVYELDLDTLSQSHREGVVRHFCTDDMFRGLMLAGGAVELVYHRLGTGNVVTRYYVDNAVCR